MHIMLKYTKFQETDLENQILSRFILKVTIL